MMQKLFLFTILMISGYVLPAQAYLEGNKAMSLGEHNSFTIDFNIGDAETIADLWVDYQRDFKAKKPKLDKKANEYFADDAEIEKISDNTIDIYSKVARKSGKGAVLTIWFDLGGAFLSSARHPERIAGAREWMAGFEQVVKAAFAKEALEAEENTLKDLEKELKGLQKDKEDAVKEVEKLEEELEAARQKVAEMNQTIGAKQQQVMSQEKTVDEAKSKLKKMKR
ncbi:MAG: hypothetical protein H6558_07615 [Lewinellaceae bacterium]|nr:hypothetical protein [Lewinellaceae bacterium]